MNEDQRFEQLAKAGLTLDELRKQLQPAPRKGEYLVPRRVPASQCPICRARVAIVTTIARQIPIDVDTIVQRNGARYGVSHWQSCRASRGLKVYRPKVHR